MVVSDPWETGRMACRSWVSHSNEIPGVVETRPCGHLGEGVMKFISLDSFLAFTILSFLTGLIILILFPMDYLSYSHLLTNFTPRKGDQEQPRMELFAVSQLEQVYSTIDIYQGSGILRFVPGRVGSQPLDRLSLSLVRLEDLNLMGHEAVPASNPQRKLPTAVMETGQEVDDVGTSSPEPLDASSSDPSRTDAKVLDRMHGHNAWRACTHSS